MSEAAAPAARSRFLALGGWLGSTLGPLLALAVVAIFFAAAEFVQAGRQWRSEGRGTLAQFVSSYDSKFLDVDNGRRMLVQTAIVAVAALGMTLIIISGGIDLSAGAALALSATVLAWCLEQNLPVGLGLLAAVAAGTGAGLLNGALITFLRVVPFIVTLGTMTIFLGLGKWVANDSTVRPVPAQIPAWIPALLRSRPQPEWLLLPTGVWLVLLLALLLAALLRYTVLGRHVFAIGSNEATARLCGINVPAVKLSVYALSGLFVGVAGIYMFAFAKVGNPTDGRGLELAIIAPVVIGGGSLSGGRGSVLGTLAGAATMTVIKTGCTLLGVPNRFQDMILGVIIVAAVTLDQLRRRRAG